MRDSCEGIRKISAPSSLFVNPVFAAALGMLLGVALAFIAEWAARLVTPADPFRGMALVSMMMGARFGLAAVALAAYYALAREGLAPFGIALAFSVVAGLVVEAVRVSRPRIPHTPA